MQLMEFYEKVERHPGLEGLGIDSGCADKSAGVIVKNTQNGLMTRLPVAAVEAADWEVIEDVLLGKREPQVLQHMTRVVGYFSRVENWNKSKVGELKDRRKGDYSVAG